MSNHTALNQLKTIARELAKVRQINHTQALDEIAQAIGYAHWNALTSLVKKGCSPTEADITRANEQLNIVNPLGTTRSDPNTFFDEAKIEGEISGYRYELSNALGDVIVQGDGWALLLPEAPMGNIEIEGFESTPIWDESFQKAILHIAKERRKAIHARMASDWPKRSTIPNREGQVKHPLFGGISKQWICLHCDEQMIGAQVCRNMWHCYKCGANPLDIHPIP